MQHPLILISSSRVMGNLSMSRQQSALYGACLGGAGAAGVLYTGGPSACLAAAATGCCSPGGGDIHPSCFGQSVQNAALSVDPVRDKEERALFEDFYRRRKPILGICRGVQVINVFLGGTLHQDIPAHSGGCQRHPLYRRAFCTRGAAPTVNSYHHRGRSARALPPNRRACQRRHHRGAYARHRPYPWRAVASRTHGAALLRRCGGREPPSPVPLAD